MVIRQIRQNAKDAIDGTIDPAKGLGGGFGRLVRESAGAWCDLYSKAPQFLFDSPAGGFAQGALNAICENRENFDPPSAIYDPQTALPFEGGQCNDTYEINYTLNEKVCSNGEDQGTDQYPFAFEVEGAIAKIEQGRMPTSDKRIGVYVTRANGEVVEGSVRGFFGTPAGEIGQGSCSTTSDTYRFWWVTDLQVTNLDNPADDCGDPPPVPDPEQWDNPDTDPPETDVDIDIDPPDGYSNFPTTTINITYNQENKTYEGDRFVIKLEPPDLVFEYDDADPPNFLPEGLSDWWDNRPQFDPRQFLPDGLGDLFPTPGEFWRDVFDRIADLIPTPLPGVSVGDLLDAIEDDEGETEEPIDLTLTVSQCVEGEIVEEEQTFSILPSQEQIFRQLVSTRNRAEEIRCQVTPYEVVRVEATQDPVRSKSYYGDSPQQTKKFYGWIQFTKEGELIGESIDIRHSPQNFPFPREADSYLVQAVGGAELVDEVIPLNQESE